MDSSENGVIKATINSLSLCKSVGIAFPKYPANPQLSGRCIT
jgi:hypothetical protein